jgi:SAM-dependent methyltransferase
MVKRIEWTPQLVNKFWDGVAQTELDSLSFGKIAGPQFLQFISSYLVQGRSYLDFGAGSGHVLNLLLDRGLSAAGFEPSPARQALLLKKIGQHKHFLGVKGADSNEQFDVVLLIEVVEHILDEDFSSVLDRVASFVKSGGYLVISTPNNENLDYSSVYCPISDTFFHRWQHVRSFTPSQLEDCFKKIGFSTDFLALADFSSDAALIETYKKSDEVTAKRQIDAFKDSFGKLKVALMELNQVDSELKSQSSLNAWKKMKSRLKILRSHRSLIARLHSISHDFAHTFDVMSGYANEQLTQTMLLDVVKPKERLRPAGEIDLRIGRETSIVYVGKKSAV